METILLPTTAAIHPRLYPEQLSFAKSSRVVAATLALLMVVGFAFRVNHLGSESLSEDELNKLQTVTEYRQNGLSGRNGEHPFLMKGLQTVSVSVSEDLNARFPGLLISEEAALRFPIALFGSFSILLLFLLMSELFSRSIGLVSAALLAVEPVAIGFDRIAKEDGLVLFFFLLANLLWIKGQSAAERGESNWFRWMLLSGAAFAGLMASKYYPHLLGVQGAYYIIFQKIKGRRWDLGKPRWLAIVVVMGLSFLILNPTIVLPETWREMLKFSSENRIGHDSYEFMGSLYRNQMTAWLSGVPWTFYYVFIAVKSSLVVLIFAALGLVFAFRRRMGDGRFFLFFWGFLWFMPFTFLGGKFTRYFTVVEPLVLVLAAVGFCSLTHVAAVRLERFGGMAATFQLTAAVLFLLAPAYNSVTAAPHFRLFTNSLGGGSDKAGTYFPHDEFYDASSRDIVERIGRIARQDATVACETPALFEFYAEKAGRSDLRFVSLSDKASVAALGEGDLVVAARGRRYASNSSYIEWLQHFTTPIAETYLGGTPSAAVYQLDENTVGNRSAQ